MSQPIRLPVNAPSYSAAGANFFIDKTGAIYQTWLGRTAPGSDWGSHVYRTAPGAKPQLMFFQAGINGYLEVINKELWFGYCDARGAQWRLLIDGYIDPSDTPSSAVVDVDEAQVAGLKQSIGTAQATADRAAGLANTAQSTSNQARKDVATMQVRIGELQNQITALQAQSLTKSQVEDIVWAKIWDVNYMIRLGFIKGSSDIQQVQDYLVDLASYIKRIVKL